MKAAPESETIVRSGSRAIGSAPLLVTGSPYVRPFPRHLDSFSVAGAHSASRPLFSPGSWTSENTFSR